MSSTASIGDARPGCEATLRLRPPRLRVLPERQRQLRFDARRDVVPDVDERLHRLDGGHLLRVVDLDAVPLPRPVRALDQSLQPCRRTSVPGTQRGRRDRPSAADGGPVLPRQLPDRREGRGRPPIPILAPRSPRLRATAADDRRAAASIDSVPEKAPSTRGGSSTGSRDSSLVVAARLPTRSSRRAPRRQSGSRSAISWYQDTRTTGAVPIATTNGPATLGVGFEPRLTRAAGRRPQPRCPPTSRSARHHDSERSSTVSFHVSRTGVPVLVQLYVPYFPNWQASGADLDPSRSTPNLDGRRSDVATTSRSTTGRRRSTGSGRARPRSLYVATGSSWFFDVPLRCPSPLRRPRAPRPNRALLCCCRPRSIDSGSRTKRSASTTPPCGDESDGSARRSDDPSAIKPGPRMTGADATAVDLSRRAPGAQRGRSLLGSTVTNLVYARLQARHWSSATRS